MKEQETILVECWEAYERDSQNAVAYLTEESARNTTFFEEIDLVAKVKIRMTKKDYENMKKGLPFY